MITRETEITGWGLYPRVRGSIGRVRNLGELEDVVASATAADPRIARGMGRSYGDAAISDLGTVVECLALDRYRSFDPDTGVLTCDAGVTLEQILADFVPRGWMPMVTPGTKFVSVGGCIANDVHGKAHHVDGCFSRCTESFRILTASGEVVHCSPTDNADLYWANFGGMGLLGVIVEATIRLRRVQTAYFTQRPIRAANLAEMMDAIDGNHDVPYAVAWIDAMATGDQLGRGVLNVGDHASLQALPLELRRAPFKVSTRSPLAVPFEMPSFALNNATIRMLNVVIDQLQGNGAPFAHYEKFVYPLDFVGEWNRGYGAPGFTQYQFVIPLEDGRRNVRELLQAISSSGQLPFLNVLKRMGPERAETLLSFPFEGWTFAIDFPVRPGLDPFLQRITERVVDMGGRIYLGKDAFLTQAHFERMYPRLDAWKQVKAAWDPDNVFSSSLGRRLGLS